MSIASVIELHTFVGNGVILFSSPKQYFPVFTKNPLIPIACAPAISFLTS
jgi:hypothetical protein